MLHNSRAAAGLVAGLTLLLAPVSAQAAPPTTAPPAVTKVAAPTDTSGLRAPKTSFWMKPDGSSGKTQGGEGIPNIDSVKKTIATYYGDSGDGIADKKSSPYIDDLTKIIKAQRKTLADRYDAAVKAKKQPALVFDTDDTTLFTYDMEVGVMHFAFTSAQQKVWVDGQKFPATPLMVDYVNTAEKLGYRIIGLTGRNDNQKKATLANLRRVGYTGFHSRDFYTKWVSGGRSKPSYVVCKTKSCTTVEYKAGIRRHIVKDRGFDIVASYGDQWSDLQGGWADATVKLPNPTYYLPSANRPGVSEPKLAARNRFTMKPDGSSGKTQGGEGIPNIDSVKKTIAVYYGDSGDGVSDKKSSPYLTETKKILRAQRAVLKTRYAAAAKVGRTPALIFDVDDTTLSTYDMEVGDMHYVYTPARQDVWVQDQRFAATPGMVGFINDAADMGFTIFGVTGRNDDQKKATLANLKKVGYKPFRSAKFFTKWTGKGTSQQPGYIDCGADKVCSTIEYKSQTRAHIEASMFTVIATYGDQYSDLLGGHLIIDTVKLPNPTYYLP